MSTRSSKPVGVDPVHQLIDVHPIEQPVDVDPIEQGIGVDPIEQGIDVDLVEERIGFDDVGHGPGGPTREPCDEAIIASTSPMVLSRHGGSDHE